MRGLSPEENRQLKELKRQLLHTHNANERSATLTQIERLLNNAKQRYKFLSSLDNH